jgi:uncharacterized protein (DUF362 family)
VRTVLQSALDGQESSARKVVIKPNWVIHETDPAFPISGLVTSAELIEATVDACLEIFPKLESLVVCDVPLQYADWNQICHQSGLNNVIRRLSGKSPGGAVSICDLRKDRFQQTTGSFLEPVLGNRGDARGYREIELGQRSHLEPLSSQARLFAVNDYSPSVTRSNHSSGSHRYLVSQSVLDADLFINLPKWKTHQKTALTGALKNLVGINGDKAYLPHFRRGAPAWGGDEYKDDNRWLYWLQTTLRETMQKRSKIGFRLLKPGWEAAKRLCGIETRFDNPNLDPKRFYIAGGAWYGNDTIWRMIYDLNLIIQCADREGRICVSPQRKYLCIVDGIISGEGNGPIQALPRATDMLVAGTDPFEIDTALAWFMGFDPEKIPIIKNRFQYGGLSWGDFAVDQVIMDMDGETVRLVDSPINYHFVPPPGWMDHVER